MKVIQIKLRTPGVFLGVPDPEQGIPTPALTLKIQTGSEWKNIELISDIKVLKDSFLPDTEHYTTGSIEVQSVDVPLQGEGVKYYNLLVPDNKSWNFRIEATPCIDCVQVFQTSGLADKVLEDGIGVIVAEGTIQS